MVWLDACQNGFTAPIILNLVKHYHMKIISKLFFRMRTLKVNVYGGDFLFQQDNATPHTHKESLAWCEESFVQFIGSHR